MLEGLEVSEVNFKGLKSETEYLRFDSEFQLAKYKDVLKRIEEKPFVLFGQLIELLTDGKHGGVTETDSGVIFLRTTNIKPNKIDLSDLRFISDDESSETKRAEVEIGDLLLTTIGTVGDCVVVDKELGRATINQNLVRIVLKDKRTSSLMCAFFNSKYGKLQTLRWAAGNVYQMINYPNLRLLRVPNFSINFTVQIVNTYDSARELDFRGKSSYTQAETLLLDALGMADFTPSSEAVNIKSFKDSFAASGRLDAEYYQPKYEEVVAHIKAQAYQHLIDLVDIQKSVEPGSDVYCEDGEAGLPFLRVADYSKQGLTPPQKQLKSSYVSENWDKLNALKPRKNTILFSKDGSVGEAYCLTEDLEAVTSGAVLHLSVKNADVLLPEYLTLALNSKLVKMQSERDAGGSIILHWRVSEIENVVVPLVDMTIQRQIADLVQQSFALKEQSTHLLDVAKRAVEIAIEQDEAAAMVFVACEVNDDNE